MIEYTITSDKQKAATRQNVRKWWVHSNGQKVCKCWSRNQARKIKKGLEMLYISESNDRDETRGEKRN